MIPLDIDWSRPLIALLMICITIIACYLIYAITNRRGW